MRQHERHPSGGHPADGGRHLEHALQQLVGDGLGVSLNNQLITRGWDTTGIVILPVDPPQYAEIGIAAPAPEELSPAAKRFLAFARQTLRTDPEAAELGKEQA